MLRVFYEPVEHISMGYLERQKPWDMYGQHYHNSYELYFMLDGDRNMFVNGTQITLTSGDFLVMKPYTLHYAKSGGSESISRYVMNVTQDVLKPFLTETEMKYLFQDIQACKIHFEGERASWVRNQLHWISKYLYQKKVLSNKLMLSYLIQFMSFLKDEIPNGYVICESKDHILRRDMIDAIEYMHSRCFDDELTLDDTAAHIHMSKSRFCEVFKETTNLTYLKYLNYIRIMSAERELLKTSKSIGTIAEENGFSSAAHMTRIFVSFYKVPPSEYRKRNRNF